VNRSTGQQLGGEATEVVPFQITVSQEAIDDLHRRLDHARLPDRGTATGFEQGVPPDRLSALIDYWRNDYDWRRFEGEVNAIPHYRTAIDGLTFHFLHARSRHEDALPLILTHGWPGSFVQFLDIIGPLTDPESHGGSAADAFHVVVPSLPGYGFSDKPTEPGWRLPRIARAWDLLMSRLGYGHYAAQGGDFGAGVTTWMASQRPAGLAGIHLNFPALFNPPPLADVVTPDEQEALDQLMHYGADEVGYQVIQRTRPQTIGYALADSAVGQAAWVYEKWATWSDTSSTPEASIGWDRILDNISLYWFTNSAASSGRLFAESATDFQTLELDVPVGVSIFPGEIYRPPRIWAERMYHDLAYFNSDIEQGGHFAAIEQPTRFVDELRTCSRGPRWRAPLTAPAQEPEIA
jgi:epoxide hydrolase